MSVKRREDTAHRILMSDLDKLSVLDLIQAKKTEQNGSSVNQAQANSHTTLTSDPRPSASTGSGTKQLPSIPDTDTQIALASRMKDMRLSSSSSSAMAGVSNSKVSQSYGPFFVEYSLMAEYNLVLKKKLPGVYVIPSHKSPFLWFGVLFVRQGLYQEGVFKFTLHIPENYPDGDSPRVIFDYPVYHPVINPENCECDIKRAFPKWRRNVNHLWEVLMYTRRIFHKVETKNPLNTQAATLYESDLEQYKERVFDTVRQSKDRLYDAPSIDDPHAIRFSSWDPDVHEDARKKMLTPKEGNSSGDSQKNAQTSGLSWMQPGSLQIFSKPDTTLNPHS